MRRMTYSKQPAAILALWILYLIGSSALVQADDESFEVFKISVAGERLNHWAEDLNNDGRSDIFIVHRKGLEPDETRWVSIFWQGTDGSFSTAPDQSWEIDLEATLLDLGDVVGDGHKEIVYLTGKGVRYYPFDGDIYSDKSEHLLDVTGLAVFPSKRDIPMVNFVRDWNGDGKDEIAIATFEGLSIYSCDVEGRFCEANKVLVDIQTSIRMPYSRASDTKTTGIRATYRFPDIRLLDYNSDGLLDLIATSEDRVIVYLQQEDGRYNSTASTDHLFDVRTQQEKIESIADIETLVEDLNNDGYADAVVIKQTAKGFTNIRGVVHLFWGRPEGYPEIPDQVIISEGTASVGALFMDVNGDGREDLILPSIKFSISAIIRILVTRSVKVYFNIFLLNEDNRLSERPDFTKEVKFKIDFSGESDSQAMDLEGDYNGDQRTDFAFASERDELSIYLGEQSGEDRLFTKKPAVKIAADAFGEMSSPDLNGDGYSDMIIFYRESKDKKGELQVLINKGNWVP